MELLSALVIATLVSSGLAAKILVLVPMPAKSHALLLDRIVIELANRGHQVTYVTHFPLMENKPKNLREIGLKGGKDLLKGSLEMDIFELRHMTPLQNTIFLPLMGVALCDAILQTPELKDLMKEKFDAIIGEAFTDESILAGFAYKSGAPIIGLATFMPNVWVNYMVGNPAPSSYVPDPFLGYGTKMNLAQRIHNFLIGLVAEASHALFYLPKQDELMRKHFGNDLPPIYDIIKNTSLILVNHHHSLAFPRPYNPNMIEIGGIHIDPPKKLPQELQKFMDESTEGVVLFSLGSNLQSSLMPKEKIELFLSAFEKLKQKVLWKFEADLPRAPRNVKISKWLPQNDLLAHPNLKVFFTHGGLLSTTESIYRGVPIVGIPIFGDQPVNMKHTVNSGFGLSLDFDTVTEDQIVHAINEVIKNPKYREKVIRKSEVLKDRLAPPLETAAYWIEYVIRHDGAPHLRSTVQYLKWYEKYLIDVIAVLAAMFFFSLYLVKSVVKYIFQKLFKQPNKKSKKIKEEKKKN